MEVADGREERQNLRPDTSPVRVYHVPAQLVPDSATALHRSART